MLLLWVYCLHKILHNPLIIVRALYGLKSSREAWHAFFAKSLGNKAKGLGFTLCSRADLYVWRKEEVTPQGGVHYSYILVYVNDVLIIHHNLNQYMPTLNELYRLKEGSVEKPSNYPGAWICTLYFDNSTKCWAIGAKRYIKVATDKLKESWKGKEEC